MDNTTAQSIYCPTPAIGYVSPYNRELAERDERVMVLTPWTVQNICYEIIKNYMLTNPPQSQGYKFAQTYDVDDLKTGIALEIAFNYKDVSVQKRPAVFVSRGETAFRFPTINQMIGANPRESEKTKYAMLEMPINVAVLATNVGFAEQLAEYIFTAFLRFQEVIKKDFCLRQFKLVTLSAPQIYLESKDHFVINILLDAVFDMGTVVKGDDLKLKTVSYQIFTGCLNDSPLQQ
jgi:hypothetical protein